jgi:membrane protease YdiL (CAAX protease family)
MRKVILFVALTYAFSMLWAGGYWLLGGTWNTPLATAVAVVYMFIPLTAAVMVQKGVYREPLRRPLAIFFRPNAWFIAAIAIPVAIALLALGVGLLLPGVTYAPGMEGMFERYADALPPDQLELMLQQADAMPVHPLFLALAGGVVAGVTVNAVTAFGEEAGWRGLMQRELAPLGFWRSSFLIGVIWGVWHAPLILQGHNYPEHPVAGVAMMTLMTVLLAPLLTLVRYRSGSVVAAAIFHGVFNGTAGVAILVIQGGSDLLVGVSGLAGCITLALLDGLLWLWTRRRPIEDVVA